MDLSTLKQFCHMQLVVEALVEVLLIVQDDDDHKTEMLVDLVHIVGRIIPRMKEALPQPTDSSYAAMRNIASDVREAIIQVRTKI